MIETVISPVAISRIEPLLGVGDAGVTRFSVVVDSIASPPPFSFFYNTYLKTYVTDCERASRNFCILRGKRAIVKLVSSIFL